MVRIDTVVPHWHTIALFKQQKMIPFSHPAPSPRVLRHVYFNYVYSAAALLKYGDPSAVFGWTQGKIKSEGRNRFQIECSPPVLDLKRKTSQWQRDR